MSSGDVARSKDLVHTQCPCEKRYWEVRRRWRRDHSTLGYSVHLIMGSTKPTPTLGATQESQRVWWTTHLSSHPGSPSKRPIGIPAAPRSIAGILHWTMITYRVLTICWAQHGNGDGQDQGGGRSQSRGCLLAGGSSFSLGNCPKWPGLRSLW